MLNIQTYRVVTDIHTDTMLQDVSLDVERLVCCSSLLVHNIGSSRPN